MKIASRRLMILGILVSSFALNSHSQQISIGMPSDATEGLNHVSFTVSLGGGAVNTTGSPITGSLFFLGSATNGTDYTGPMTYSIANGVNSTTLIFLVTDDAILEQTEQVTVSLGTPSSGTIGNGLSSAFIFDDEMAITSIGSPIDGTEGSSDISFSVFLEGGLSNTIGLPISGTISFSGTATNGLDYTEVTTYTIPVGDSSTTVAISVIDDAIAEVTETVIGTISSPNFGTIGDSVATANIIDDESTGSDEINIDTPNVKIYPNPVNSTLFLVADQQIENYSIKDLNGRVMAFGKLNSTQLEIDVNALPKGFYFVTVDLGDGSFKIEKVLKQ